MRHVAELTADLSALPPLPRGWAWSLPKDFCEAVASGSTPAANKMTEGQGDVPFIKVYNLTHSGVLDFSVRPTFIDAETHNHRQRRSIARPGDVLINIVGPPLGKVSVVPATFPEWNINQAVVLFRPSSGINSRYLAYACQNEAVMNRLTRLAKATAGQFNIGVSMCRDLFPVPIAPTREQERIADRVDELFTDWAAGAAALERVKKKLGRYRSAVLHAAVTGRLTAEWRKAHGPPAEPGDKLLARILVERRKQWEQRTLAKYARDSRMPPKNWQDRYVEPDGPNLAGLSSLPEGWTWATHDQVGDIQLGRQRSPQHHYGSHMRPYLRVANVHEERIDTSDVMKMNFTPDEFETYALRRGDILLNEGQSMELIGRPAMYRDEVPGCCFQNTLVRQRVLPGVDVDYALMAVLSQFRTGRYRKIARITTSIAHLGAERFAAVEFPLPPIEEQREIVEQAQEKLSKIDAMEVEIGRGAARAARLRQAILKTAFEGKLVPQDPADEPAAVLLERIKAQRVAAQDARPPRGRRTRKAVSP